VQDPERALRAVGGASALLERVVGSVDEPAFKWVEVGSTAKVLARWLFGRSLSRLHPRAASALMMSDAKWDAPVGIGSSAAKTLEEWAGKAGGVFVNESYVEVAADDDDDYVVGRLRRQRQDRAIYELAPRRLRSA